MLVLVLVGVVSLASSSHFTLHSDLVGSCERFFRDYYEEDLAEIVNGDGERLVISWRDLFQFDADIADDFLDQPKTITEHLKEGAAQLDLPYAGTLDWLEIDVINLPERATYYPGEIQKLESPGYIAIQGNLAKVANPTSEIVNAAYECQRCGTITHVPQSNENDDLQEPHECSDCQRQGPFTLDRDQTDTTHYSRVRVEAPPDEAGQLSNDSVDGMVRGELVWEGHEDYGVVARSGEAVTIYGTLDWEQLTDDSRYFENVMDVSAIEFDADTDTVEIQAHKQEFTELSKRDDAIDIFKESIAPQLYATPEWDKALELLVAYLFGAPRVDVDGGPTYRGDIHALIVSDYGMGKSMVNEAVAEFSPDCIKESVTGLSSDVGLLAAAVKDDFGQGESWTLEPGILVRGNGGHVILDEIDKTDADLERMNDALEGEQVVDINKAGQSATFKSRVGLLATGNPKGSRFDDHEPVAAQLDIDESLLSRFDGIVTMRDTADENLDAAVAERLGHAYVEAHEYEFGDRDELEQLDRVVSPEVGRAWVAYAREQIHPHVPRDEIERIKDWYANEIRQLNKQHGRDNATVDMPVPATARVVGATIRFSAAFARVHLRETVTKTDVDWAMELSKTLIGQTFDSDSGQFVTHEVHAGSQKERRKAIISTIAGLETDGAGVTVEEVQQSMNMDISQNDIEKLLQQGEIYEPATGEYRVT